MTKEYREKSKIVSVDKCDVNPVLISFQNATPDQELAKEMEVEFASGKKGPKLLFAGTEDSIYSGPVVSSDLVDNFICVRNKTTNKMRLVAVDSCSLLSQHHWTTSKAIQDLSDDKNALRLLLAKYGGKKAARAHEKYNRMKTNVDVIKDQLDQTIAITKETIKIEKIEEEALTANDEEVEPSKNYEAKKLNEIYDIEHILTKELSDELQDPAEQVLKTPPEQLPISHTFLISHLRKVQTSGEMTEEQKLLKTKLIIFLDALINLVQRVKQREHFGNRSLSDICENVEIFIRRNFNNSNNVKCVFTQYTKKKAVCYIIILCTLLSSKFDVSVEDLILMLKMEKKAIIDFSQFLNMKTALGGFMIGLKLPSSKEEEDAKKVGTVRDRKRKR